MKRLFFLFLVTATCTMATGCVHRHWNSITYLHPDFNTLNQPALHIDKYTHQPPKPRTVDHYRWMYTKGPIDHTLVPELYSHQPITSETLIPASHQQIEATAASSSTGQSKSQPQPTAYISSNWMFQASSPRQ